MTFTKPTTATGKRRLAMGAIFSGALAIGALIMVTGPNSQPETAQEKAWPVSTVQITKAPASPTFRAFGRVQSRATANLSTDLSAKVAAVLVSEGDLVRKGQTLVQLDAAELELALAERQANLAEQNANLASAESELAYTRNTKEQHLSMYRIAKDKLKRHRQLVTDRLISQSLYDEVERTHNEVTIAYQRHQQELKELPHRVRAAQAQVRKAKALLSRAELNLDKATITAPFTGPILKVMVSLGDRLLPGSRVLSIADAAAFELRVPIPDIYLEPMRRATGTATMEQIYGEDQSGEKVAFNRLAGAVATGQSGLDAFFQFDVDIEQGVMPAQGQVMELTITMPPQDNLVSLPPQAIYDNKQIYAVVEDRLQPIPVKQVGETRTADGDYHVLVEAAGLAAGEMVITTQLPKAVQGMLVNSNRVDESSVPTIGPNSELRALVQDDGVPPLPPAAADDSARPFPAVERELVTPDTPESRINNPNNPSVDVQESRRGIQHAKMV